jgi:hypothetical protein
MVPAALFILSWYNEDDFFRHQQRMGWLRSWITSSVWRLSWTLSGNGCALLLPPPAACIARILLPDTAGWYRMQRERLRFFHELQFSMKNEEEENPFLNAAAAEVTFPLPLLLVTSL